MLELCFHPSAAGMLAEAMPGGAVDILCLGLALSAGDITEPLLENGPRYAMLHRWLSDGSPEGEAAFSTHWQRCVDATAALKERAPGEPVRIWADQTPDAACGLLFTGFLISELNCPAVTVVPLPLWQERSDGAVVRYWSWSEVSPERCAALMGDEMPLSPAVLRALSTRWRILRRENAPLRVLLNGQVTGVAENFYDPFLLSLLAERPRTVGELVGAALGQLELTAGGHLLTDRVQALLDSGRAVLAEERPDFWACTVSPGE